MSIVAPSHHHSMDAVSRWGMQFPAHAVAQVLPPPRSYYVVSWVPRALPEVVQLIREIPTDHERCLINKHFELGMLVMRRCGVQNPEEIKCLLDGFREGTTRLSSKEMVQSPNDESAVPGKAPADGAGYSHGFCCSPVVERRKLLIFFNDHRASRPWVLCPAKHCIKSARTTGKVKGRVKIFQYDQRSSSVKVPKLFLDCLSDFMTRDQYVFATFCPQQKYTDHELEWFDLPSQFQSDKTPEPGGDIIFRELVEEHDTKGTRVWPFEDYIIFSNSQAKIVAVFKKKQPLLTLYRHTWPGQVDDFTTVTTTASSMTLGPFLPTPTAVTGSMVHANAGNSYSTSEEAVPVSRNHSFVQLGKSDDVEETAAEVSICDSGATATLTTATSTTTSVGYGDDETYSDVVLRRNNILMSKGHSKQKQQGSDDDSDYNEYSDRCNEDDGDDDDDLLSGSETSAGLGCAQAKKRGRRARTGGQRLGDTTSCEVEAVSNDTFGDGGGGRGPLHVANGCNNIMDCYPTPLHGAPNCGVTAAELLKQADDAEQILVRIMARVLARLEPLDDSAGLDLTGYGVSVATPIPETQNIAAGKPAATRSDSPSQGSARPFDTEPSMCNSFQHFGNGNSPVCAPEGDDNSLEWRSATTTGGSSNNDVNDVASCVSGMNGRESTQTEHQKKLDMENRRRKAVSFPSPNHAVLYHDLIRQFLSRLAFGLDHPPLPQKRIPDTVKRVVTNIREVNLALLTSSIRCHTDLLGASEDTIVPGNSPILTPAMDPVVSSPYQNPFCAPSMPNGHMGGNGVVLSPNAYYLSFESSSQTTECRRPPTPSGAQPPSQATYMPHYGYGETLQPNNSGVCGPLGVGTLFQPSTSESTNGFPPGFIPVPTVEGSAIGSTSTTTATASSHFLSEYLHYSAANGALLQAPLFGRRTPTSPHDKTDDEENVTTSLLDNDNAQQQPLPSSQNGIENLTLEEKTDKDEIKSDRAEDISQQPKVKYEGAVTGNGAPDSQCWRSHDEEVILRTSNQETLGHFSSQETLNFSDGTVATLDGSHDTNDLSSTIAHTRSDSNTGRSEEGTLDDSSAPSRRQKRMRSGPGFASSRQGRKRRLEHV